MERIAELSHKLESLLDLMRRGERSVNADIIDLLMGCNDRIGMLVNELDQHQAEQSSIEDLVARLEGTAAQGEPAADEPAADEQPATETVVSPAPDSGVVYGEEYDQELFDIFMSQFDAGLQALAEDAEQMRRGDPAEAVLTRCMERVATLRSSANYMEYEDLRNVYDNWLQRISEVLRQLSSGGQVDMEEVTREVITANINRVRKFFQDPEAAEVQVSVDLDEIKGVTDTSHDLAAAIAEQFKDLDPGSKALSIDDLSDDEQFAAPDSAAVLDEDAALLDKLASAFDAHIGSGTEKAEQTFPEDIENHLLSGIEGVVRSSEPASLPGMRSDEDLSLPENLPQGDDIETMLFSGAENKAQPAEQDSQEPPPVDSEKTETDAFAAPTPEPEERRNRYNLGRRQSDKFHERVQKQSIRVDAVKIDALMNQVGELVVSRSGFNQLFADMRELQSVLKQSQRLDGREMQLLKEITNRINEATISLSRVTSELQENVMKVRMLPIAQLFSRYPRLVHDLVRNTEKKVDLEILGEETELDKMVIEQLADPLIHVIRNAVDHGIEDVATRRQKGKPETGILRLEAYHEANYVVIEISDDGQGMDVSMIKKRALEKGFISAAELDQMNDQQLISLIMRPGFSTATEITHTSGRGVGMDVVKDSIEKLNGTIEIDTTVGTGARFRIKIPLTLAIIPALLVRLGEHIYTIPLSTVEETIRIENSEISTIEGIEVFYLRDATIPLIRLNRVFNMDTAAENREELFVVVVNTGVKQVGFVVDELKSQQEVVIKPLEDYLQEKSGFSGATLLGDGSISLILDVFELVELSLDQHSSKSSAAVI